ncbi:MAG: hypothetical protein RIB71_18960 [Imperialibacter sp.]|uniref:hypothetical protein n=1 Tax=Imperialibacter sp. TaxID=2038411 RepID=UPI0032ED179D
MATNKPYGDNARKGPVTGRSQTQNRNDGPPKTGQWTKRDTDTGRFMDGKKDGAPFKWVRKEK